MHRRGFSFKLNKKGFTFVECICAIALFAIIGTMAFSMFSNATRYLSNAKREEKNNTEAQTMIMGDDFTSGDAFEDGIMYTYDHITSTVVTEDLKSVRLYFFYTTYTVSTGDSVSVSIPVSVVLDSSQRLPATFSDVTSRNYTYHKYKTTDGRIICVLANELPAGTT